MTKDCNVELTRLFGMIENSRTERVTAGTQYRLKGLAADIMELSEILRLEVLTLVSKEAVLDADVDIDYAEMAETVLTKQLEERPAAAGDAVQDETRNVNTALGVLSQVLSEIADALSRHHRSEEYVKLFENEQRRYLASHTARKARQTFEEWKEMNGKDGLTVEDLTEYRMTKLMQMFKKGVFNKRVEQMQRAKRYPGEVDFDQVKDDDELKPTAYRHYAVLRRLVDFTDGCLVEDAELLGRYFYNSRHEENAKGNRTNYLKYMHKVKMAQEELRRLIDEQQAAAACHKSRKPAVTQGYDDGGMPEALSTPQATALLQKAQKAGFINDDYQPLLSRTQSALLANALSTRLGIINKWKTFETLWHRKNMRGDYNLALSQQQSIQFQDKLKRVLDK